MSGILSGNIKGRFSRNAKGSRSGRTSRVMNIYEVLVWILYACLFKYAHYLDQNQYYLGRFVPPPEERSNFPYPQLAIYAVVMTLYIIPFYRWIVPALLRSRRYFWIFISLLLYFLTLSKLTNWIVSGIFLRLNTDTSLTHFYQSEFRFYTLILHHIGGMDLKILLTDIIAFLSIAFMRFALETEQKKHLLEKDNLVLQLESLKAQLHPHFLFNTLNSIYGMSLTGSPQTPDYILKLSEMMRFILYDCQHNKVPLEKDIEFLLNYITMEQQRYPMARIEFTVEDNTLNTTGTSPAPNAPPETHPQAYHTSETHPPIDEIHPTIGETHPTIGETHDEAPPGTGHEIAPLLFIPFAENSFKHGSHRVLDKGHVYGRLSIENDKLHFIMENDVFVTTSGKNRYGGVGIDNVRRRLELYYPGRHTLQITNDQHRFSVDLRIWLHPQK